MLNTSENTKIKKDIHITKVDLWALFGTLIVKKLAPIFVSCSAVTPSQSVRDERELWVAQLGAHAWWHSLVLMHCWDW